MRRVLLAALIMAGCGGRERGDDDDVDDHAAEVQACIDLADAWGDTMTRCVPGDPAAYQSGYNVIVEGVGGDCDNTVAIRDLAALNDECIPWTRSVDCGAASNPRAALDPSCVGQVLPE